jgi:hypothetical protein
MGLWQCTGQSDFVRVRNAWRRSVYCTGLRCGEPMPFAFQMVLRVCSMRSSAPRMRRWTV